jgi:hypothetical protein
MPIGASDEAASLTTQAKSDDFRGEKAQYLQAARPLKHIGFDDENTPRRNSVV